MLQNLLRLPVYLTILFPLSMLFGRAPADIFMSVTAVLFLAHSFAEKDWQWTRQAWVRTLFVLWIYMLVRGLFADNPYEALHRSLPFARYFVFAAAAVYWTLQDVQTRTRFFQMLTAVVLFLAVDGFVQWLFGTDITMHHYFIDHGHIRLSGPFHDEILGIMIAWLCFPVCIYFVMNRDNWKKTAIGIALAFFVIVVIALSGERMALLLTLFGWLIAIFLLPIRKIYLLVIPVAAIVLVALLATFNAELLDRQVFSTLGVLNNWHESPYGKLLDSDLHIAGINPVFGIGANHFRIFCKQIYNDPSVCNIHPHNIYMEWFIEEGIIGLGIFIFFIGLVGKKLFNNWQNIRNNPIAIGFLIGFIIRIWPFASSTSFSSWGAPPFWLIFAGLLVYITLAEKKLEKIS